MVSQTMVAPQSYRRENVTCQKVEIFCRVAIMLVMAGEVSQAEGTANAKAMRWKQAWEL